MKHTIFILLNLCLALISEGQSKFPYDSVSHSVTYNRSYKLSSSTKKEDVYAGTLKWFEDSVLFTHYNAPAPGDAVTTKKNKRQVEAEDQFNNHRPLQMQDPNGGKIQGMGLIRYYGNTNASIKLLYIKYDINIHIVTGVATVSISNIRYFHYQPVSYKQVPLYAFGGGKPCEEVGTIEAMIKCENFKDEFENLAAYCNKEVNIHLDDYGIWLKQKKYLYDPKAKTAPKVAGKPTSKKK